MSDAFKFQAKDQETGQVFNSTIERAVSSLPFLHREHVTSITVTDSYNKPVG